MEYQTYFSTGLEGMVVTGNIVCLRLEEAELNPVENLHLVLADIQPADNGCIVTVYISKDDK